MNTVLDKKTIESKRQTLLARLKKERIIQLELVVDTLPSANTDDDDGLTIPDFRKTLQR